MKRFFGALGATLFLLLAASARAHEGHSHQRIMGTVSNVERDRLVMKSTDGETVSVRLTQDTEYSSADGEADRSDVKVGDRVVVIAMGKPDDITADEVRLSSARTRGDRRRPAEDEAEYPRSRGFHHAEPDEPESSY